MIKTEITIAIAKPDDAESIYNVQRLTWLATYPNAEHGITKADIEIKFPPDSAEAIERKRSRLLNPGAKVTEWIAKDASAVVGWVVASKKPDINELGALYVLPAYQGKRVGAQLMKVALHWLGHRKAIVVSVAAYNDRAINFYESWGFHSAGLDPDNDSILPSGTHIPALAMIRPAQKSPK